MLNIQISGNIYNEVNALTPNVRYKGYHKESNTWSDWYETGTIPQYNINLGDAAWLSQDGSVNTGDTILILLETKEIDPLDRIFALYEFKLTTAELYVNDVQLLPCQKPNVIDLWDLSSDLEGYNVYIDNQNNIIHIARVNDPVIATSNFNDEHSWIYNNISLRHVESVYNQDIFSDRLSIENIEYQWSTDALYSIDTTHIYSDITLDPDYYTITVKVTNQKGQISYDTKYVEIRYNTPILDIYWTPMYPSILDNFNIITTVDDPDNTVTNIEYRFDGDIITNNTILEYSWMQALGNTYIPSRTVSVIVTWSDGYSVEQVTSTKNVTMTNIPPVFNIEQTIIGLENDNNIRFTLIDISDPDGQDSLLNSRWVIEYLTPIDNTYKTIYDSGYPTIPNTDPKEWIFEQSGTYRILVHVRDSYGAITVRESIVTLANSSNCTGSGKILLNNNNWQLVAIPVENKKVSDYFGTKVTNAIKTIDASKDVRDVIEVCTAYPGHINKHLSFVPGYTPSTSEHNFSLTMVDGSTVKEVTAFWVKCKNYYTITNNIDLVIDWSQED